MTVKKLISAYAAAVIAVLFLFSNAYASEDVALTQAYMNEKSLDIFTSSSFDEENLYVKVANREADVIDCGTLSDEEVSVCTTILVDISTSMPLASRGNAIKLINLNIKNLAKNEQLRIVTFGAEIKVLQDFTSDRYDLDKAVEGIKFKGAQSAVYDAIYNTIPDINPVNDMPCFYRTIVITDGVDSTTQGATKEELYMKLQALTYPLDIICASSSEPTAQNKELSALTRISSGRYFDLYSSSDIVNLSSGLSVGDYFWIRAEVPTLLLDGSTRQIDVSDGTSSISFDMKLSVVDAPVEEPPVSQASTSSPNVTQPVFSSPSAPVSASNESDDKQGMQINLVILILIIIAGVAVVSVVVVIVVRVIRSNRNALPPQTIQPTNPIVTDRIKIEPTEFIEEHEGKEHYSIKISNTANQGEYWILDVFSDIIIGRADSCNVIISEISVAHEQCKIAANKNGLVISNLSKSNKTRLNGTILATEVPLHPADNIHFGRITLRVDYIQKVTDEVLTQASQAQEPSSGNSVIGKTRSIF